MLSEIDFRISNAISIKAGGSATFNLDAGPTEPPNEFTGIAGIAFTFRPGLSLKYHFEYLGRQNLEDGIRNILVLDAKF